MRNTFSSTLCAGLLIGGVPGFAAAQTETPATTIPATPPATPAATDGTAVMISHTVPVDPATTTTAATPGKGWSQIYLMSNQGTLPETRVNIDVKNAKIKDVLKDILAGQAKIGYIISTDIAEDTYISVKLDNVKIETALDAITESAGLKWQVVVRHTGNMGNAMVRVSKSLPDNGGHVVMPKIQSTDPRSNALLSTRVNIKLQSTKFSDALKAVAEQAKFTYVLDADVPDVERETMTLAGVPAYTALNMITRLAGVSWSSETREGKTTVRISKISKSAHAIPFEDLFEETVKRVPQVVPPKENNGKIQTLEADDKPAENQSVFSPDGITWTVTPYKAHTPDDAVTSLLDELQTNTTNILHKPYTATTQYYTNVARSQETRSTFTCPNCHNQVTILRKNVEVKCPTCQRPFEAGWKVCPFDGTKRPVAKDDWKFCPICGKAIPDGVASLFSTPEPTREPEYYAYQPSLTIAPLTSPYNTIPRLYPPAATLPALPIIPPPPGDYK